MATTLGAHLSPLELDSRIMSVGAEASLAKIYALEAVIDANLEADYLYAEYTVLREGGDMDDLELLYLEAEQAANAKKEGLISQMINWISTNLSRFFGWLSDLFGKKLEKIDPNQTATVNKYEMDRTREIVSKWDKLRAKLEDIIDGIKNNNLVKVGIGATGLLSSVGLGFLIKNNLEKDRKENDKGETTTVDGKEVKTIAEKLTTIRNKADEWMKFLNEALAKFKNKVDENARQIQQKKNQKKEERANQNNQNKTDDAETTESVITAADLFGAYVREADEDKKPGTSGKPEENQSKKDSSGSKNKTSDGNSGTKDGSASGNVTDESKGEASSTGTGTDAGKKQETASPSEKKTDDVSSKEQPAEQNTQSRDKTEDKTNEQNNNNQGNTDENDPDLLSNIQGFLQTLIDMIKTLLDMTKNIFLKFTGKEDENANPAKPKETDGENPEQKPDQQPNQQQPEGSEEQVEQSSAPLDYTQGDYVSESRRINLFGIDESDFDYLTEMSDDDKADIDFLLENL